MVKVNCLNPISKVGMKLFSDNYEIVDDFGSLLFAGGGYIFSLVVLYFRVYKIIFIFFAEILIGYFHFFLVLAIGCFRDNSVEFRLLVYAELNRTATKRARQYKLRSRTKYFFQCFLFHFLPFFAFIVIKDIQSDILP